MALTTVKSDQIQSSVALAGSPTTTTQSASDNSTKVATTAYVETAVANLVASAPAALNTLDELAAALNDDASFSTTVTNSIATKLPLAGGTMTGDIISQDNRGIKFGTNSDTSVYNDGSNFYIKNNTLNQDIIFLGNDDGSTGFQMLKLDASNAGTALFGGQILTPAAGVIETVSSAGALTISGGSTNKGGKIELSGGNNTGTGGSGIKFYAQASTATPAERMRISATGLVGINDQNPDRMVSIIGDTSSGGQYPLSLDATNTDYIMEFRRSGTSEWWFKASASNFTVHENGVGDQFSIYSGSVRVHGLLGVNKGVNAAVGLSVGSDASTTSSYGLEVCNSSSNTRFLVDGVGSSFFYKNDNNLGMKFDASSGNVGIGNTNPDRRLYVDANANNWTATFRNVHASAYGIGVDLSQSTASNLYALAVYTPSNSGMFVNNHGDVNIGNSTAPGVPLMVNANNTGKISRFVNRSSGTQGITIGTTTGDSAGYGLHVGHQGTFGFLHPYNYGSGGFTQMQIQATDTIVNNASGTEVLNIRPGGQILGGVAGNNFGLSDSNWNTFGRLKNAQGGPIRIVLTCGHNSYGSSAEILNDTYAYGVSAGTVVNIGSSSPTNTYHVSLRKVKRVGGDYASGDGGWEYQIQRQNAYTFTVYMTVMGVGSDWTWTV